MKRAVLLVALALLVATPAFAGGEFDLFASYVSFEQAEEAFGVGIRFGWNFSPNFTADFAATLQDDGELTPSTDWYGNLQATPLDFGVKYRWDFGMYVGGGASYVFFDTDNTKVDDEIGFYGRIGYEHVGQSGWGWFVEGIYRDVDAHVQVGEDFVEGGVDMSGPGVVAGAKLRWE